MDCFVSQPNGEPPIARGAFENILKDLLDRKFRSKEIIAGLKQFKFDHYYFTATIERRKWRRGKKYRSAKDAYDDIFKRKKIYGVFEKAFKECLESGFDREQILSAFTVLYFENTKYDDGLDTSLTINSAPMTINDTTEEAGYYCTIQ